MPEEKKFIIDEDWKAQVQAEKEAAAKKVVGEPAGDDVASAGCDQATEPASTAGPKVGEVQEPAMPPASIETLITTLATETLVALGQMPHPMTGKAQLHRHEAQYLIDTLDVLRQKTQGNLTADEQQLLDTVLHQLRIVFVEITSRPTSTAARQD